MENTVRTKVEEVFVRELALIQDPNIRDFVIKVANHYHSDDFYIRPASKSKRYHPHVMNEPHGLVYHTKYAVWWACELLRAWDDPKGRSNDGLGLAHSDVVIAATILHDFGKNGLANQSCSNLTACHGVDLANAIVNDLFDGGRTPIERPYLLILQGIASHMGVWTLPRDYKPTAVADPECQFVAHLVATADYCASRQADVYFSNLQRNLGGGDANGTERTT